MNHAKTLLRLSVQDFFSQCNWQGQPAELLDNVDEETIPEIRLSLSVGEYFRLLPWEGTPTIGSLPKSTPNLDFTEIPPEEDVTLDDLLDSF
jgi:hypothetical protein